MVYCGQLYWALGGYLLPGHPKVQAGIRGLPCTLPVQSLSPASRISPGSSLALWFQNKKQNCERKLHSVENPRLRGPWEHLGSTVPQASAAYDLGPKQPFNVKHNHGKDPWVWTALLTSLRFSSGLDSASVNFIKRAEQGDFR